MGFVMIVMLCLGLEEARVWLKTMAALITIADTVPIPSADLDSSEQSELETATCHCCGLIEECTLAYIAAVSRRYNGRWICGLCSEAINDEICRSKRLISTEEAVNRHVSFCRRSGDPPVIETAEDFIAAIRQILRRRLDSPRAVRSPAVPGIGGP